MAVSAILSSCSDELEQMQKQELPSPQKKVWTISINAGKTENTSTRGVFTDDEGTSLKTKWYGTEAFTVSYGGNDVGTVTATASETASTTLVGELDDAEYVVEGILTLTPTAIVDYSGQTGTIESMSTKDFLNETTVTINSVGESNKLVTTAACFTRRQSFIKFAFDQNISSVEISAIGLIGSPLTITPASARNTIYVALSNTNENKQIYKLNIGSKEGKLAAKIENGVYYSSPTIVLAIPPAYGNAYYSDGTWGNNPHSSGATIIGMVCYAGNETGVDGYYRGLVMALTDAATNISWSDDVDNECLLTQCSTIAIAESDMDGKTNTDMLLADGHSHPAASAAKNYTPIAPNSSSGWFLPSSGQWAIFLESQGAHFTRFDNWVGTSTYSNIKSALDAVSGTMLRTSGQPGSYWSSSEYSSSNAIDFPFALNYSVSMDNRTKAANYNCVRSFLAF